MISLNILSVARLIIDVDGQTSTALLVQSLRALNANVVYYVPVRGRESHGVHIESLTPIIDNGAKLLLTCDTGITAHKAIDHANSRGVGVIVTDHHDIGGTLPNAKVIINPKKLSTIPFLLSFGATSPIWSNQEVTCMPSILGTIKIQGRIDRVTHKLNNLFIMVM